MFDAYPFLFAQIHLGATAIGWSAINYPDLNDRAVAVAAVLMIGNGGNIIASYLFRSEDAPKYGRMQKKKKSSKCVLN